MGVPWFWCLPAPEQEQGEPPSRVSLKVPSGLQGPLGWTPASASWVLPYLIGIAGL